MPIEMKDIQHAKNETCAGCAFCLSIPLDSSENLDEAICTKGRPSTLWVYSETKACQYYESISSTVDAGRASQPV